MASATNPHHENSHHEQAGNTARAGGDPSPSQVYVRSITYGGSGCPQGTVGSSFSNDRKSLTLIFDRFTASMGSGIPVTENRKNCQLNINIVIPQGFSTAVATVDYRGYVQLPAGSTAEQKSTMYFQGEVKQASAGVSFRGPIAKDYLSRDTIPFASVVWMPCGRTVPLNINAQTRLIGSASTRAQITTDSIDGKVKIILGLQYRRC